MAEAQATGGKKAAKVKENRKAGSDINMEASPVLPAGYVPRMKQIYRDTIRQAMVEQFGYANQLAVPRLDKIVLNMGVGEAVNDTKKVTSAAADLSLIAGQKPIITYARNAISTFKVREGMPLGAKVTLRDTRMYEFLDRLVTVALPRIRDFPWVEPEILRWPRQLRHGHQGAYHLPRDRLRQGRDDARHGHHRLHHGEDGRRGARASEGIQFPVPAVRSAGEGRPFLRRAVQHGLRRGKERTTQWLRRVLSRRTNTGVRW